MCYVKSVNKGTLSLPPASVLAAVAGSQTSSAPQPSSQESSQTRSVTQPLVITPKDDATAAAESLSWLSPPPPINPSLNPQDVASFLTPEVALSLNAFDVLSGDSFDLWLDLLSDKPQSVTSENTSTTTTETVSPINNTTNPLPLFPALMDGTSNSSESSQSPRSSATPAKSTGKKASQVDILAAAKRKAEEEHIEPALALKRARNNEAARRSRERKLNKLQELDTQVQQLEGEKSDLMIRLAVLENERSSWVARERELVHRVMALESQLGESHRALMSVGLSRPSN